MARPQRQRPTGRQLPQQLTPKVEPLTVGSPALPESGTPDLPQSGTAEVPESGTPAVPKYARMQRRDARLRPDQWRALDDLLDRLKAARADRRERLTDNTLLRVAVDLLLAHADELGGDTERALHASLGLPESGSSEAPEYRSPDVPESGITGPGGQ